MVRHPLEFALATGPATIAAVLRDRRRAARPAPLPIWQPYLIGDLPAEDVAAIEQALHAMDCLPADAVA